jgi:Ssp1 endopeptidase immunity protein Rap1a
MRRTILLWSAALCLVPAVAAAVKEENFIVKNTRDLIEICGTPQSDAMYTAAINFCQGYVVGAYAYHRALYSDKRHKDPVCLPDPPPPRMQAIASFVEWAKANPKYEEERAVEALAKFLTETWPCPQSEPTQSRGKTFRR